METAYPNPSKILPLEFKINRQAYLRFNISVDNLAPTTTGWTWQLFIKRFPGDRKNIVSLTLGNGLSYEVYSDTTLVAHFTSAQLNIEEAEYYWELVRTDIENTWIEGPANFTFSNKQSDDVQSAEFDVNVDSSGTPVTIEVTAFSSATSSNFLVKSLNLSDVANAATALSNLGGQPLDSDLTAIAALSTTSFGRSLLTLANAAALLAAAGGAPKVIAIACSDETTALTAGTGKATFRMPYAMTLTAVRASLTTAQTSGSIFTVDINEGGTTILSTKITIDNTEKTSTTAATAPVISDTALADDAEITIDIDQIGDGTAKGLKVYLIG